MKLGVTLAIDAQNAAGGIRGRQVELDFRDDEYQPSLAEENARALIDVQTMNGSPRCPTTTNTTVTGNPQVSSTALNRGPNAVLAFLGNVGTPTMVRAAPVSLETNTLFFGAFTGANTILRDTSAGSCAKYIFNVRASYAQEARATLEFFLNQGVPDSKHLVSFDQNDSFGRRGLQRVRRRVHRAQGRLPLGRRTRRRPSRASATRATTAPACPRRFRGSRPISPALLAADNASHTVGILMTDTYAPATAFITGLRQWQFASDAQQTSLQKATRLTLYFSNVSFVGPNTLAQRLKQAGNVTTPMGPMPYTTSVFVSQVVPNYQSDSSDVVTDYQKRVQAAAETPGFTSLEGYVAARVFVAGLLNHQGPFTPDSLIASFEGLPDLSLGIGASSGFGPGNHDYSKSVWGTSIASDGSFQNVYFWSDGTPIQFFE